MMLNELLKIGLRTIIFLTSILNRVLKLFSGVFRSIAKRPDFLVVIRHLGIIAVDVKSQTINPNTGHKDFVLDEENEVKKYIEFEKNYSFTCLDSVW